MWNVLVLSHLQPHDHIHCSTHTNTIIIRIIQARESSYTTTTTSKQGKMNQNIILIIIPPPCEGCTTDVVQALSLHYGLFFIKYEPTKAALQH